jgi:hypothetical protein
MKVTPARITVDQRLRCARIYPVKGSKKSLSERTTVTLFLTAEQASQLASALKQETEEQGLQSIRIDAFRALERDGNHRLSVTGFKNAPPLPRRSRREQLNEDIV